MLNDAIRPDWFKYPEEYLRVIDLKIYNLEPWFFLDGEQLERRNSDLKKRFPNADLVPFARRMDNDDVACWEKRTGNLNVYVVHDFSQWGWDKRKEYPDFWAWYRQAVEDMIEHGLPYR